MILSCNSCNKKFVVPDQAIASTGRMVQCGSCGNKWKQFPIKNEPKKTTIIKEIIKKDISNIKKIPKSSKRKIKKVREINLYSPEYLEKKHGIKLSKLDKVNTARNNLGKKVSFGFYNSLLVFIIFVIAVTKILHFSQDLIIFNFPFTKVYLNILFENIKNIFEIFKSLVVIY